MDILREFRQWVMAHWAMLEAQGVRIALGGQIQQQTVKTNQLTLFANDDRFQVFVIVWEFGNCDAHIADMEPESALPLEECIEMLYYEELNSREAINSALESILKAFCMRAQLNGVTPPPV